MTEILIILAVVLISYFGSLRHSYIVDDISTFKTRYNNQDNFSLKTRFKLWGLPGIWRFITERLYGACTFTYNIELDNAFRIFLYAGLCVMIYLGLSAHLVTKQIAFWAAILYAVHPINNQISLWANGRRYVVNIMLVMVMLMLGPLNPWSWLLYLATISFQVTAIFSPVIFNNLFAYLLIPAAFLCALPSVRRKISVRLNKIPDADRRQANPKRLIVTVKHFGHYFFKMVFPGRCQMTYKKLYFWGITAKGNKDAYSLNGEFGTGCAAIVCSLALLYFVPASCKGAVVFFILATLQWCAIVPFTQDLADRYSSMPNVFMMMFISYFINTYFGQYALAAMIGLSVYYFVNLKTVTLMYRSIGHYFEYHRYFEPSLVAPRKYETKHLIDNNDIVRAWVLAQEGLKYNPDDFILLLHSAICHRQIGDIQQAKVFAEIAEKNYYIGHKEIQEPQIKGFMESLRDKPVISSRQARRAMARMNAKKNADKIVAIKPGDIVDKKI